ncbi:MAG: hypothetical protein C3F13_06920 [Anaerolineales bacterium]|nr:O-antigen ligase family protein [Anaerolineae bacterium]PWB54479.1 MAG: hypothetical protein C3F13_06920 [Anaerolineales bacterium]
MEAEKITSTNSKLINWLELIMAIGLFIFLIGLPFQLVIKSLIPGPVGTYWKEFLLGVLLLIWAILSLSKRKLMLSGTAMDLALLVYIGYVIVLLIVDRFGYQTWWGFYSAIMYLPIFWVVLSVLRRFPDWFEKLIWLIIILGSIVAFGGVLEFILNRSLWPSSEIIQRQGFPDVFIYGTHLRRVYFVFDSPTTLANTLALIFPLSLAMIYASKNITLKILAGAATLIMITCIGLTFSRGIWVASAVGLVVIGLLAGIFQQNKKLTLSLVGLVIFGLVAWVVITSLRANQLPSVRTGLVELTSTQYRDAPALDANQNILRVKPTYGNSELQTWTIFDPLQNQNDQRTVINEPANNSGKSEVIYPITVPDSGALKLAIALDPQVWSPEKGDGVDFQVYVTPVDTPNNGQFLLDRYINPKINPSDRRWRNYLLDLSPWSGKKVNISLITGCGPAQNCDYDWSGWADVSVVSLPQGYFSTKIDSNENIILKYFRSISDWARDETNLDRLAAWNLAFDSWRKSPILGTGLGSTGFAALRSNPTSAFVTESQVLKVLTEMGLPGIILWGFVWFAIVKIGIQTFPRPLSSRNKAILIGILTSLIIIFIEGWVYQNMEAKQVNALFWTLTGMLAFISTTKYE